VELVDGGLWLALEPEPEARVNAAVAWVKELIGGRSFVIDSASEEEWLRQYAKRSGLSVGFYDQGVPDRRVVTIRPRRMGLLGCTDPSTVDELSAGYPIGWAGVLAVHLFSTAEEMREQLSAWSGRTFVAGPLGGHSLFSILVVYDGLHLRVLPNRTALKDLLVEARAAARALGYSWRE